MKTLRSALIAAAVARYLLPTGVMAKATRLAPENALATTAGPSARAALKFNLSDLEGSEIRSAHLELTLNGVSSGERSEFQLYVATANWSGAQDVAGLTLADEPLANWDIEVQDYERAGGFVRFDVTETVRAWIAGELGNSGLVIVTGDMSAESLSWQMENAVLVIRN